MEFDNGACLTTPNDICLSEKTRYCWVQLKCMAARPRISYEEKNRLYELAESIEATEPSESRSFSEALSVVLDHAEETPESTEADLRSGEDLIEGNEAQGNVSIGQQNQRGLFNQNDPF